MKRKRTQYTAQEKVALLKRHLVESLRLRWERQRSSPGRLPTRLEHRRKRLHRDVIAALPRDGARVAHTVIPSLSLIERMAEHRAPVPAFAPTSPAARHYESLWAEVRPLVKGQK